MIPHLNKKGEFHLIFDESEFPYKCPIVHDHIKLNDDFVKVTYEIWLICLFICQILNIHVTWIPVIPH